MWKDHLASSEQRTGDAKPRSLIFGRLDVQTYCQAYQTRPAFRIEHRNDYQNYGRFVPEHQCSWKHRDQNQFARSQWSNHHLLADWKALRPAQSRLVCMWRPAWTILCNPAAMRLMMASSYATVNYYARLSIIQLIKQSFPKVRGVVQPTRNYHQWTPSWPILECPRCPRRWKKIATFWRSQAYAAKHKSIKNSMLQISYLVYFNYPT